MSKYRYPLAHADVPAFSWSELTPGKRFALMEIPGHIDGTVDRPIELLRASVMGAPFTSSLQGYPAEGKQVVNLLLDNGTVKTITSSQWGFGPMRVEELDGSDVEIHGTHYCTPID